MLKQSQNSKTPGDLQWDRYVRSVYGVWEITPEFRPSTIDSLFGLSVALVRSDSSSGQALWRQLQDWNLRIDLSLVGKNFNVASLKPFLDLILFYGAINSDREDIERHCAECRDDLRLCNVPIIVLLEDLEADTICSIRRSGATYCLRVPMDHHALAALMSIAVQNRIC